MKWNKISQWNNIWNEIIEMSQWNNICVHFCHKTVKCELWILQYFWSQKLISQKLIWICPVKHCLIWCILRFFELNFGDKLKYTNFKLYWNSWYFTIKKSVVRSNLSRCFCLICIFWNYYRNSFWFYDFKIYWSTPHWKFCFKGL